jgi:homospermidine synthase
MIDNFYFIGCGMVATALLEVFNMEKAFYDITFTIIEPEEIKTDLLEGRDYNHIKDYLTEENHRVLLNDISDKTLIIDLSVELDSLMVIKYAKIKGALYINTSVENWESFEENKGLSNNYEDFKNNTLYHRELEVDELLKNTKKTRVVNMGMNPGGINEYTKLGLKEYAKSKGKHLIKGNYAKLAHELGLKKIVIAEYDSALTDIQPKPDTFYNTWSPLGAQSEFADYVMLSLNNEDLEKFDDVIIKPNEGKADTHIRFIAERGMDMFDNGICLDINGDAFEYSGGMLIPHAEVISMSDFYCYNGDAPTIFYCYRPSQITLFSTDKLEENNYLPLPFYYGLENKDIINNGIDSIGALMFFENGDIFWAGTVQSQDEIVKMGFKYAQATTVQVAGWIFATIVYIIKHPQEGFNEPDTLHSKELFKIAKKYQGKSFFKQIKEYLSVDKETLITV